MRATQTNVIPAHAGVHLSGSAERDGPAALGPSYGYLGTGWVRISVQC